MVKDILVCLEGSPSSGRATEVAVQLARAVEGTLVGLAIVDEPDIRAGEATGIGGSAFKQQKDATLLKDAQEHAQKWLDAFTTRCAEAGVAGRALELRGRPAGTILEEMQRHDLTLLGREANFRFETAAHDRQTRDTILHKAGKPVVVVPETVAEAGPAVLLAYDGSSASKRALRTFAESGLSRDRPLHVLSVDDVGSTAWETAKKGCDLMAEVGVKSEAHGLVSTLSIAEAILQQRRRFSASLIVLGAYAHSRLTQLLWGSVTHELVEKTDVPLYLHH